MAIDQAIMESVSAGGPPTLRFYGWNQATLSLGYFQSHAEIPADCVMPRVRRTTGGGAIVHDRELTYSLTLPLPPGHTGARRDLYVAIHSAISDVLQRRGITTATYESNVSSGSSQIANSDRQEPFLCFRRRAEQDLICSDYKVLGSAQRHNRGAFLQHGSLLLSVSPAAPALPGLSELTGQRIEATAIASEWGDVIADHSQATLQQGELTAGELDRALQLASERFGNDDWTLRR